VEVFELVVVCCLPAASSFQSSHKGTPSRKLNNCYYLHYTMTFPECDPDLVGRTGGKVLAGGRTGISSGLNIGNAGDCFSVTEKEQKVGAQNRS
jgi:hypothetical protein